jgi:hypothetical protein
MTSATSSLMATTRPGTYAMARTAPRHTATRSTAERRPRARPAHRSTSYHGSEYGAVRT